MDNKELIKEIATELVKFEQFEISAGLVIKDLEATKVNWELGDTLEQIWKQERMYYLKYGMSAFDTGYIGGKLTVEDIKYYGSN